jgi:hypothetical protein
LVKLPTIQSVGAPPEEHADRVVAEMMRVMVQSRLGRDSLINAAINLPDGNPKAQAKLAKKLQDIGWPFIFDVNLFESGKRGRYALDFCSLNGWNPITKKLIFDEQSIPHKPWLAFTATRISSKGNHAYDETSFSTMFLTHHSLSRLVQRSNVKHMKDLLIAIHGIWLAYVDRSADHGADFSEGHRLTFKLHNSGNAMAVLNHYRDMPIAESRAVVSTII